MRPARGAMICLAALLAGCGGRSEFERDGFVPGRLITLQSGWRVFFHWRGGDELSCVCIYEGADGSVTREIRGQDGRLRFDPATGNPVMELTRVYADPAPGLDRGAIYLDQLTVPLAPPVRESAL